MTDWTIHQGHVLDVLPTLEAESVQCCVTSPPYWGLRDYGTADWQGGDEGCDHISGLSRQDGERETPGGKGGSFSAPLEYYRQQCGKCGATRRDDQLGLEPTPELFLANMVAVFREVRRVLRPDGTLWLNMGDSYAAGGGQDYQRLDDLGQRMGTGGGKKHSSQPSGRAPVSPGLKPKDLCGIPWRLALALQADGWYLRADIIWAKPNPMPESVTDRPTKAHEYIFLLTKQGRYYYDAEAVREKNSPSGEPWGRRRLHDTKADDTDIQTQNKSGINKAGQDPARYWGSGRNARSVWTIPTQAYPDAHFATFPEELPRRCIAAGTSERGCCPACGAGWVRDLHDEGYTKHRPSAGDDPRSRNEDKQAAGSLGGHHGWKGNNLLKNPPTTTGWEPNCGCKERHHIQNDHWVQRPHDPIPATVLDPFAGSGTTLAVAARMGRRGVGIELNPDYIRLAEERIRRAVRPNTSRSDEVVEGLFTRP